MTRGSIDVDKALIDMPPFDRFPSVAELASLADSLRGDRHFDVRIAGESAKGRPIHHIRFGHGSVRALFVAFPHCKEPVGGLTVVALIDLLRRGVLLREADVEWHIVPCIDPDGAALNEGWTQRPFTLENYMRNYYEQPYPYQVDTSFPLRHKKLVWDEPSTEAAVLREILATTRPDFFYSLHNAWTGGMAYYLDHDIDHRYHDALYRFLGAEDFPIQKRPIWKELLTKFGEGIVETWSVKKQYDYLERMTDSPEVMLQFDGGSWDYIAEVNPRAVMLVAESGYLRHPMDGSEAPTGENLRKFKLRIDAESKFLGSVLVDVWEKVKGFVDPNDPLYGVVVGGWAMPAKDKLEQGGRPLSLQPTGSTLFNPDFDREMTEGDKFQACFVDGGFFFLPKAYELVRLLKSAEQTQQIAAAVSRLDSLFDQALGGLGHYVDLDRFTVVPHDVLARVQLGSGLIVLNSVLERA